MNQTPEELGRKIKDAQERQHQGGNGAQNPTGSAKATAANRQALRAATDLVAAVFVGGLLGYWLDRWLDSTPWMMIIFLILGFAAGFLNIYRAQTGQDYKVGFRDTKDKKE